MTAERDHFLENVAPPCHECGEPIVTTEIKSSRREDGEWYTSGAVMVCRAGHRTEVEPFD